MDNHIAESVITADNETVSHKDLTNSGKQITADQIPIRFEEVWISYDTESVVRDINFSITPGEFAAILGPNGSGKTTLMKLALGLLKPS